jgi:transmembrane sensor
MPGVSPSGPGNGGYVTSADTPEHPATLLAERDREAHDWMMRFAGGRAGAADLAAFKEWSARDPANADAFARACRLWEALEPASDLLTAAPAAAWPGRGPVLARRAFLGGALAASAAGAGYLAARPPLGLWPSVSQLRADYRTAPGEQRSIALTGGPSVELNTRTSIALRGADGTADRIELIGGEAAFTARTGTGRPVEVTAGQGRVTASDADFNIRYDNDVVCTTCVGGEVGVAHGNLSARLRPGEQVLYSSAGLSAVAKVDAAMVTAWKDGVLVFQTTLDDAVAEINRYRPGRIIVTDPALGRRLFNARFKIANIDGVVGQIQKIFGAAVTSLPGGIVLLG